MRGRVLVVDDLSRPRRAISAELEAAGFTVDQATNGQEGLEAFKSTAPNVVVTDVSMPKVDGFELLNRIRERSDVPVIVLTATGTVEGAVNAFKSGADDFLSSKDLDLEQLVGLVTRVTSGATSPEAGAFAERIVGASSAMVRVRERIYGLAALRTPVLVIGEPGSGRDLVVQTLHEFGASGDGPLLKIDRHTQVSQEELRGARAVYLDGIEDLPQDTQALWERWLRDGERHRLERWPRVFASTASMIPLQVEERGTYHELRSLLLRFAVEVPPLRSIPSDIPLIADAIVEKLGAAMGRRVRLSASAREFLAKQRWPRNAGQLEELLERAIAFTRTRQIRRDSLEELLGELEESIDGIRAQHRAFEREQLLEAIRATGGNVSRTAERLGRSRGAVYRMIEKYDITLNRPA